MFAVLAALLGLLTRHVAAGIEVGYLKVVTDSPQSVGLPFPITVTARADDGTQVTTYNGPLTLTASAAIGQIPLEGGQGLTFTSGLWSGNVTLRTNGLEFTLLAETTNAVHGSSSPINVLQLSLVQVPLLVEDMVYDSSRRRIYVSAGSSVPVYSNSVLVLNPDTGALGAVVPVGPITTPTLQTYYNDGKLALSDNGQYLYVAYSNATLIRRIDLATMTAGASFGLGTDGLSRVLSVADMEVIPGQPLSVAVAKTRWDIYNGISVFDNGVQRPTSTPGTEQYYVLAPSATSSLVYALGTPGFCRLSITASGITRLDGLSFPGAGSPIKLEFEGSLCFVGSGAVIDPAVPVMLGKCNPQPYAPLVAPDTARRRVCFLSTLGSAYAIQPHNLDACVPLKPFQISKTYDYARCFIRCGTNSYAFSTSIGQVFLVQSPLLTPTGSPADLAVVQTASPLVSTVGSNLTLTVTVSNTGPAAATDVTVTDLLDNTVNFVSANASQGASPSAAGGQVVCNLGNLAPGSNATLTLTVRPSLGGWLTNSVTALANESDTNIANNVSLLSVFSSITAIPDTVALLRLPCNDIAYGSASSRLYATVPARSIAVSNAVIPIDPLTGQFDAAVLSAVDPGRLAVSDDSHFLYVGAGSNQIIWRVDLQAATPSLSFAVGANPDPYNPIPYGLDDMEVLPGQPHALAISRRRAATPTWGSANVGIAIFDDGVPRPLTTSAVPETDTIEFGATARDLYGYNRPMTTSSGSRSFRQMDVGPSGVTLRLSVSSLITGQAEDIRREAGLLFTTGGSLIDPQARAVLGSVGSLQTTSLVEPDPASGRVFYLIPTSTASQWVLRAYDFHTLAPLGSLTLTNVVGTPGRLVRWGSDGLAIRTSGDQLFVLRTSLLPFAPPTDLGVACQWSPSPGIAGSNVLFTITATNQGPQSASNVVASFLLPTSFTILTVTSPQGTCATSNLTAFCRATALPSGGTLTFTVQARPASPGLFQATAGVLSANAELQASDNSCALNVAINTAGKLNQPEQLSLPTQDMVLEPVGGNLLASVGLSAPVLGGSIVAINPATGQVEPVQQLGMDPSRLAATEDGSFLYVGAADGNSIVRLALQSHAVTPLITLGTNSGQLVMLQDMETVPGTSNSVALSWVAGSKRSIVLYDEGVARTNCPVDSLGGRFLAFGETAETLYANGNGGRLRALAVMTNGLTEQWGLNSLLGTSEDLEYASGHLYTSAGKILNPAAHLLEATLTGLSSDALVKTVTAAGRVVYLTKSGANWSLQACDSRTLGLLGSLTVTNVMGAPSRLVQWGTNGFAFRTSSNQVFLLRTDLLPASPPADLALFGAVQPAPATANSNLIFTLTITNLGPNTASNAVFTDRLSADATLVSATSTRGTCTQSNKVVSCQLGSLAAGAYASVAITVVPQVAGMIDNLASVVSSAADPNLANNSCAMSVSTLLHLLPNSIGSLRLDAADLVYDGAARLLYASVSNGLSVWRDSIVAIDPLNGQIQPLFSVPQPSRMALSDDGEYLYVATESNVGVQRFHLPSRSTNLTFYVRDPGAPLDIFIRDLAVAPGAPSRLAVALGPNSQLASGQNVLLYQDATPGVLSGQGSQVEFVSGSVLFGHEQNIVPDQTYRMYVQSNGLAISNTVGYLVAGQMKFDSGFLYTASGQIVDPGAMSVSGTFPVGGSLVEPRVAEQRVYLLKQVNSTWTLYACDATTRQQTGSLVIPGVMASANALVRCGYDLLAFRTATNQVCLLRTSLVPAALGADSDADGMPDSWEVAYGLDILSATDANTDTDGDGMSNLNEYLAGTNPTNAASVFRLGQSLGVSGLDLSIPTAVGKHYRVERTWTLAGSAWETLVDGITGTGTNLSLTFPISTATNHYFRAVVLP